MTGGDIKNAIENGTASYILAGTLVAVLSAAAIGAFTLANEVSAMRADMQNIVDRVNRHDDRLTYIERHGFRHPAQGG